MLTPAQVNERQALWSLQEEQRHRDREVRDQASLEALARYDAATKAKKVQEAEERKMAKCRVKEVRLQEDLTSYEILVLAACKQLAC